MKHTCLLIISTLLLITSCSRTDKNNKTKDRISPQMATTLRNAMVKDLSGTEIAKTNDIQKYCNCVVDSLQLSFTTQEIMEAEFTDSRKYKKVQDTCLKSTRIK